MFQKRYRDHRAGGDCFYLEGIGDSLEETFTEEEESELSLKVWVRFWQRDRNSVSDWGRSMNKGFIWKVWVVWKIVQIGVTGSSGWEEYMLPGTDRCTPDSWEQTNPLKTILSSPQFYIWNCLADVDRHQQWTSYQMLEWYVCLCVLTIWLSHTAPGLEYYQHKHKTCFPQLFILKIFKSIARFKEWYNEHLYILYLNSPIINTLPHFA